MKNFIKKKPLVSIIMPVYNSGSFLFQAIDSAINQTYKNWELLIVDDCSYDNSKKILNYFKKNKKIKIFFNKKNNGPAYCRNIGLKKSKGKYVAFLDSDDVWFVEKLQKQVKFMESKNVLLSCTEYIPFNNKYKISPVKPKKKYNFENFINDTSIATSTMMINRLKLNKNKFLKGYGFDDYIFKAKLLKRIPCYTLDDPLTYYRIRTGSVSSNKFRNVKYVWNINKRVLKLNFFLNILSIIFISLLSLKKYNYITNKKSKFSLREKKNILKIKKKYYSILNKKIYGPKVSIIMPSYNSESTLKRAIESIFKQNYENWELIFVNDCSNDETKKLLRHFKSKKIKYFENNARKGQAFSRNLALKKARGYYIAFLDSDDEWHPYKLEHQINFMRNLNLDVAYTNYFYISKNKKFIRTIPKKINEADLLQENIIGQSTVIYKSKVYKKYNFSDQFRMDFDLWLKIIKKNYNLYGIKEPYCNIYSMQSSESKKLLRNLILNWKTLRVSRNLSLIKSLYYILCQIKNSLSKRYFNFIFQ